MAISFEAKKHAWRQTQDGIVVSFVLHPQEINPEFAVAALGTRYMVAVEEIGDDEKPKAPAVLIPAKAKRKWDQLSCVEQACIRCGEPHFQEWLKVKTTEEAADAVRHWCNVTTRSDIKDGTAAATRWRTMEREFDAWLTTQKYSESVR